MLIFGLCFINLQSIHKTKSHKEIELKGFSVLFNNKKVWTLAKTDRVKLYFILFDRFTCLFIKSGYFRSFSKSSLIDFF